MVHQDTFNPTYLLAWIPESLLTEKGPEEWAKFYQVEQTAQTNERPLDDDGKFTEFLHYVPLVHESAEAVLVELPTARPEFYTFSVPLSSIYSLIVHQPSLSSWCESVSNLFAFPYARSQTDLSL